MNHMFSSCLSVFSLKKKISPFAFVVLDLSFLFCALSKGRNVSQVDEESCSEGNMLQTDSSGAMTLRFVHTKRDIENDTELFSVDLLPPA